MIDYVICLDHSKPSLPHGSPLYQAIRCLVPDPQQSINQTPHFSLRQRPLAVSIETKTIGRTEEEARVQLAVWVAAQVKRLRHLVGSLAEQTTAASSSKTAASLEPSPQENVAPLQGSRGDILAQMVFPLIYVNSEKWVVFFARPSAAPLSDKRIVSLPILILYPNRFFLSQEEVPVYHSIWCCYSC